MHPVALRANTLASFYRGSGRIAAFRNDDGVDPAHPEDWIASTTTRFGASAAGLTRLDGGSLAAVLVDDPDTWLGPDYQQRYGAAGSTLVKLLDAGVRLPLHVHPDRPFAAAHLHSDFGKSEAWLVLQADPGAVAYLGFTRDVGAAELAGWVQRQDVPALLEVCNRVPLHAGDVLYCPGGIPHSIGAGVLILEVQEMTDFSIMLEWDGFPIDARARMLGLPRDTALAAVDRSAVDGDRLASLRGSTIRPLAGTPAGITALLPHAADALFHAEHVIADVETAVVLDRRFALLVVTEGAGRLEYDGGSGVDVVRGDVLLVPHAAGPIRLSGPVAAIRCSSAGSAGPASGRQSR